MLGENISLCWCLQLRDLYHLFIFFPPFAVVVFKWRIAFPWNIWVSVTLQLTPRLKAGAELVKNKTNWSERRTCWRRENCFEQRL